MKPLSRATTDPFTKHQAESPERWQRIMVVIDPTAAGQPALEKAARIALRTGGSLELYVCDVQQDIPESWTGPERSHEYRDVLRARAQTDLQALAQPLREDGLTVTTQYEWHAPLEQGIGHHVIRSRPDLVVKQTHRHDLMNETLFSRTDWNLVRQVPAALLLVRHGSWPETPRIAAAVDPLHPADRPVLLDERIVHAGCSLASALQGQLEVFHVLQPPPHLPGEPVPPEQKAAAESEARRIVDELAARSEARTLYAHGGIAEGLVGLARAHAPDILVMGAGARPRSAHSAAGGTAARVLERVECDLLVVKPPGFVSPLLVTTD